MIEIYYYLLTLFARGDFSNYMKVLLLIFALAIILFVSVQIVKHNKPHSPRLYSPVSITGVLDHHAAVETATPSATIPCYDGKIKCK